MSTLDNGALETLGWGAWQLQAWVRHGTTAIPARIVRQLGNVLFVDTGNQVLRAMPSGKLKHQAATAAELPVVGDWVLIDLGDEGVQQQVRVQAILPRETTLARRRAGNKGDAQLLAANVDCALLVWALERTPNLRLLQRAIVLARAANIEPRIVLTKSDLVNDGNEQAGFVQLRLGVPTTCVSTVTGVGVDALAHSIGLGKTAVLFGPSGAGKSSLVNWMLHSNEMRVGAVTKGEHKGQHTTTHRELFRLPGGGLLLDGPGVREFGLLPDEHAVVLAFPDIGALAAQCQIPRCGHTIEPDCAVLAAVADGRLQNERVSEYHELLDEAAGRISERPRRGTDSRSPRTLQATKKTRR